MMPCVGIRTRVWLLVAWAATALSAVCVNESSGIEAAQCKAWNEVWVALSGANWLACSDLRQNPCKCSQVTCTPGLGITRLHLENMNLRGAPPPQLGALTNLNELKLTGNPGVAGSVPAAWAGLTALSRIGLSDCAFNGTLPVWLTGMSNLFSVEMERNAFSGVLPPEWGAATAISDLRLSANRLNGTIPAGWATLTRLSLFYGHENELSGSLPPEWKSLRALQNINLGLNRLGGTLPSAWGDPGGPNLKHVELSQNEIGGTLPESWGSLPELMDLLLNDNRIEGTVPLSWSGANMSSGNRLEYFKIQNNRLRGILPNIRVPTGSNNGPCDVRGNYFACPLPAAVATYCVGPDPPAHSGTPCCDTGLRFEGLPPAPRQCRPCAPGTVSGAESALACSPCPAGKWQDGPNCTECAAGRYAPVPGSTDCAICPYGQQQFSAGASSCNECAAGQFYSAAIPPSSPSSPSPSAPSVQRCFDCAPGRVANLNATAPCASNTSASSSSSSSSSSTCAAAVRCVPCAAGRFQPKAGGFDAAGAASCSSCSAGTFSGTSGSASCEQCPAGRWSAAGQASCGDCAIGFEASSTAAGCVACAAGRFSVLGGRCTDVTVCEAGSRVAGDPSAGQDRVCAACAPGLASHTRNAAECTQCPTGRYADRSGAVACAQCGRGQFQNASGQAGCVACALLFGGTRTATASVGTARAEDCISGSGFAAKRLAVCGDGQQPSASQCEQCPAGRFKAGNNTLPCALCECGAFSGPGASSCGVICAAGTYGNAITSTCDPCPQEHFCVDGRARPHARATQCSPGTFVSRELTAASDRECALCPAGQVSRESNAETCTECTAGRFQLLPGQAFCETVPPCKPGEYAKNASAVAHADRCAPCPVGSWCVDERQRVCDIAGYHCDEPGLSFPKSCSEGFVCAPPLDKASSEPVQARRCPEGMQCTATTMEFCPSGTISTNATGKCVSCEDGYFAHRERNRCERCPDTGGRLFKCAPGELPRLADPNVYCARCRDARGAGTELASLSAADFLPCRVHGACNTTVDVNAFTIRTRCAVDSHGRITRQGALCGACAEGFGAAGPSCTACPAQGTVEGVLAPAALVFIALFTQCVRTALRQSHSQSKSKHLTMTSLKILVSFLYTTSLLSAYQLDWGENLRWLFGISSAVATGDASAVALTSCIGIDLHTKMKLVCAAPLIAMLLPLPILGYMRLSRLHELERADAPTVYRAGVLIAWWLMHPAVVRECLLVLLTTRVGDDTYVAADLSVSILDPRYTQTKWLAIGVLSTFATGLPLLVFGALYSQRAHLSAEQAQRRAPKFVRQHLFYFYGSFHPKFYYWEVAQFTLKTVMVTIAAQASVTPQPGACLFAATWIMLFAYMLEYRENAYRRAVEGRLMQATLFGLLGLLLAAQGLAMGENEQNDSLKDGARALAAVTTLSIVIVFLGVTTAHCARTSNDKLKTFASRRGMTFSSFRIAGSSRGSGDSGGAKVAWKSAVTINSASSDEAQLGGSPEWVDEQGSDAARASGGWSSAAAPTKSISFEQVNPMQLQSPDGSGRVAADSTAHSGTGNEAGDAGGTAPETKGSQNQMEVSGAAVGHGGTRPVARSVV